MTSEDGDGGLPGAEEQPESDLPAPATSSERVVVVEESGIGRPYMRGIMVHSLMARGVDFEEAYRIADAVRERIRGRGSVQRSELTKMVRELLGAEFEHQPPIPVPLQLQIRSGDRSEPFSKGTLSQSLLAASVEPDDAFEVAREIEVSLIRQGRAVVDRATLRGLAHDALLRRFGPRTAARYLVWRAYQEPEKPVIILLGGTTGAGKTTLALEVARRLGISRVLSTDSIRQVMRIMLSPQLLPAIHVSSFDAAAALSAPLEGRGAAVHGFLSQASTVAVGVRAIIDRAVEENTSLVLDGVSLVPGLLDIDAYADSAHVFFMVVARLDEQAFRSHFESRARREKRRDAGRYVERLDDILAIQDHILDVADRMGVPIVDNITLEGSVLLVIRHVVETLRQQSDTESEADRRSAPIE